MRQNLHAIYSVDVDEAPSRNADGSMRFRADPEHDQVLRWRKAVALHNRRVHVRRAEKVNKEIDHRIVTAQPTYSQRLFLADYHKKKNIVCHLKQAHMLTALNNFSPADVLGSRPKSRGGGPKRDREICNRVQERVLVFDRAFHQPQIIQVEAMNSECKLFGTAVDGGYEGTDVRILCEVKQSAGSLYSGKELEFEIFRVFEPQMQYGDTEHCEKGAVDESDAPDVRNNNRGHVGLVVERFLLTNSSSINRHFLSMNKLRTIADDACLELARKLRRVKSTGCQLSAADIPFISHHHYDEGQVLDVYEPLQLALDAAGEELLCSVLLDFYSN